MAHILVVLFKVPRVVFMAGNLLERGLGVTTRNLGASLTPLFSVPDMDQRATLLIVLANPWQHAVDKSTGSLLQTFAQELQSRDPIQDQQSLRPQAGQPS